MFDLIYSLALFSAVSLALGLAGAAFELLLFIVYKLDGGRLDLFSYIKKL